MAHFGARLIPEFDGWWFSGLSGWDNSLWPKTQGHIGRVVSPRPYWLSAYGVLWQTELLPEREK